MRITPIAAIASAAGLTASLLLASPAQASPASTSTPASEAKVVSPAPSSCKKGFACIWRDKDYGGDKVAFEWLIDDYSAVFVGTVGWKTANDIASSVYNNGGSMRAQFWQHIDFKGPSIILKMQTGDRNLSDANGTVKKVFNDRISSSKFVK